MPQQIHRDQHTSHLGCIHCGYCMRIHRRVAQSTSCWFAAEDSSVIGPVPSHTGCADSTTSAKTAVVCVATLQQFVRPDMKDVLPIVLECHTKSWPDLALARLVLTLLFQRIDKLNSSRQRGSMNASVFFSKQDCYTALYY